MGHKVALVRPDVTISGLSTPNLISEATNEAGTQTTLASVTHFWIEAKGGFKVSKFIDNKIKSYVNKGRLGIPLNSIYRTFVFNDVYLGNLEEDESAQRRLLFLDYATSEWHKLTGKSCPLYFYNDATGAEWFTTSAYAGSATIPLFSTYKGGAFTRSKVLIEKSDESHDNQWNSTIDQLVITEVWL